ncbi:50S ribosomal protein L15 [Patescibacteria group bacterium]|nr:50S ribosomal protein L15 [Patescibacteria group bacterium]
MKLQSLKPDRSARKRVGRGPGSGRGKTAGRGTKGQKSRSGHHMMPAYFEGGQMPLTQRLPKLRGFRNPNPTWGSLPVDRLDRTSGATVDLKSLQEVGMIPRAARRLKVVGPSSKAGKAFKLDRKISLKAEAVTESARKAITAGGGTVTVPEAKPVEPAPETAPKPAATKSTV